MFFLPCSKVYAWNIRNLYRSGSLKTVARELWKCKIDLWVYRKPDQRRAALNGQRIIHFFVGKGVKITSQGQVF
jgi:hypothetical protein